MKADTLKLWMFIATTILFTSCKQVTEEKSPEQTTEIVTEAITQAVKAEIRVLAVDDFEHRLEAVGDVQLIDVRTAEEVAEGAISGAINVSVTEQDFEERMQAFDKEKAVYVYCRSGGRSATAAGILMEAGFTEIYDLEGGITAWIAAGKEVMK